MGKVLGKVRIHFVKEVGSIDSDVQTEYSLILNINPKKPSKFEKRIREMRKVLPMKPRLKITVKKKRYHFSQKLI